MGRERRRRARRTTEASGRPARPATPQAPDTPRDGAADETPLDRALAGRARVRGRAATAAGTRSAPPHPVRSPRVLARESANMLDELKRVAGVSAVCFGMLAILVVVDRLS